jgi:hypothetical protein
MEREREARRGFAGMKKSERGSSVVLAVSNNNNRVPWW